MDLYTFLLVLGAAGLATMALRGFGGGHAGHGHAGGHAGQGHGGGHGHTGHPTGGHAAHAHGSSTVHGTQTSAQSVIASSLLHFASPRVLFSICLGAGAVAPLLRLVLGGGPFLFIGAIGTGIIFERIVVNPIWNFAFRFASAPALMLESCVEDEGTAVTTFDKNGQGLIAVDLDGQVVQLLATLQPDDRALGAAVRAGDRVRIAAVDSARNRCTVTAI
jgi:hypothetical protein